MKKYLLLICFTFAACAKPNYQNISILPSSPQPQDSNPQSDNQTETPNSSDNSTQPQETANSCTLFFTQSNLCAEVLWQQTPIESTYLSLILKFYSTATHTPTDPTVLPQVVLWMPSMNHGSSPSKTEKISTGLYRVFNIYFIMPGEWDIHFQLKQGSQINDDVIQKITL